MSSDRETTRLVRSWLDEGVTTLPDRVLDAVLDELPATRQRRLAWWPARRIFDLNRTLAFSLGAAAIVIVAILGFRFLVPSGTSTGGPPSTPTPTPSPMAWPTGLGVDLAGGTYVSEGLAPIRSTITVPDGWIACGTGFDELGVCAGPGDPRGVTVSIVDNVVSDPCDRSRPLLDPPIGASVDDLVSALSNLSGFEATDPIDITLNGFAGKEFELMAPADPACALGSAGLGTWTVPGGTNGVGPGEVNLLRIVDVDGVRVMIAAAHQPVASANLIAEVRAISDSIHLIAP